jgi:arylsulfatase
MNLTRREFIKWCGASAALSGLHSQSGAPSLAFAAPTPAIQPTIKPMAFAAPAQTQAGDSKPNILYFHIDNLGIGELGCYGGGILRGADTRRIDQFAAQGTKLLNFAPEAQCTPSRAALMTGRYSIRSGCHTIPFAGEEGGLVAWECTMGDVLSDAGYACACYGKWHIGTSDGRWPTNHGFDEWYGPIRSYDECLWPTRAEYDPRRDARSPVLESSRGKAARAAIDILTTDVRRDIDLEYLKRAETFIRKNVAQGKPFYIYFNHSMMHMPTIPRKEFAGKSGFGDWADSLLELDADFGKLLDLLDELGVASKTIVVLAGDNGAEESLPWRGTSGYWEGSYFTGMEGSLRTPCLIRWSGRVPANRQSNESVHITDMFTTLARWVGGEIPQDRIVDGVDQRAFFEGKTDQSAREGFLFWNGDQMYGVKWKDFKVAMVEQRYFWDPVLRYAVPHIYNLKLDPKERDNQAVYYGWVASHAGRMLREFMASTQREPPIPAGAPIDFNPYKAKTSK